MKAKEVQDWIAEHNIEWHAFDEDVWIMPTRYQINDFFDQFQGNQLTDSNIECIIKEGYICIPMKQILDYHEIELHEVFDLNEE